MWRTNQVMGARQRLRFTAPNLRRSFSSTPRLPASNIEATRVRETCRPKYTSITLQDQRDRFLSTTGNTTTRTQQNNDTKLETNPVAPEGAGKQSSGNASKPAAKRLRWYWKALILLGELTVVEYLVDRYFLGGAETRTILACGTLGRIAFDYKLHYGPKCWGSRHRDEDLHQRNAERLSWMLKYNGGIYLKSGQALAMQGSILPEEYQRLFGEMFDDAPPFSWSAVKKVIEADFDGRSIEEIFGDGTVADFEQQPRAAASIAQVHYARLADGTPVAVKVQRPEIANQMSWDLWITKILLDYTARSTGLPLGQVGQFLTDYLMPETDFENEASNADKITAFIDTDKSLRDRVHIPKVFRDLSSRRVLTTEWVDGVQLWDKDTITAPTTTKLRDGKHTTGLGLHLSDTMETIMELFSKQMFSWGLVHCDPHPGNILVRQSPTNPAKPQIVLLDHGLYVTLSPTLLRQYARFWKALVTGDDISLGKVTREWGIENSDAWADASLMRPYKEQTSDEGDEWKRQDETPEERQQRMIDETAGLLGDEALFPKELFFLERAITLLQGNNRFLSSPVNRIKLMGLGAVRAVKEHGDDQATLRDGMRMHLALWGLDLAFYWSRIRQYFGYGCGFEEELKEAEERQMREAKDVIAELLGIVVD